VLVGALVLAWGLVWEESGLLFVYLFIIALMEMETGMG